MAAAGWPAAAAHDRATLYLAVGTVVVDEICRLQGFRPRGQAVRQAVPPGSRSTRLRHCCGCQVSPTYPGCAQGAATHEQYQQLRAAEQSMTQRADCSLGLCSRFTL